MVWISFYVSSFSEFIDAVGDRWGGKTVYAGTLNVNYNAGRRTEKFGA